MVIQKFKQRRNPIARDLRTSKYRMRVIKGQDGSDDKDWREDLQEYYEGTRISGSDTVPKEPLDD